MKKLRIIAIVTAVIGLAVSTYLSVVKLANKNVLCFAGADDCNIVNSSSYSMWRGIPVAILGAVGYILILAILLVMNKQKFQSSVISRAVAAPPSTGGTAPTSCGARIKSVWYAYPGVRSAEPSPSRWK